jgi:hypothetical protein
MASNGIAGIAGRTGIAGRLLRTFTLVLSHATAKLVMVTRKPIFLTAIELRAAAMRAGATRQPPLPLHSARQRRAATRSDP